MDHGLILCSDLLFASKVTGVASALGLRVAVARDVAGLLAAARSQCPSCVMIDLHENALDVPALLAALRETCPTMPRVVAFGSHVDAERLRAARAAGCDLVLPRSAFAEKLPTDLAGWMATG